MHISNKFHKILSVIYLVLITVLLVYFDYNYRLSYINGDGSCCRALNRIEVSKELIWYTSFIFLITVLMFGLQLKKLKRYILIYLIPLTFNASLIFYDMNFILESKREFDTEMWTKNRTLEMAMNIQEEEKLLKLTVNQVKALLGIPSRVVRFSMAYKLEGCGYLSIQLLDSKVSRVVVSCA